MPTGSAPSRRRLLFLSAAAMATAAAIALALIASRYPSNDDANYALVDTGGTADVTTQARDLVETAFSFTPDTVGATRRAAAGSLTGTAVKQYDKLYGKLLDQASERRLSMRTSVASVGVQRLNEGHATVLVFANQRSAQKGTGRPSLGAAQLQLRLVKVDGRWKLASMTIL